MKILSSARNALRTLAIGAMLGTWAMPAHADINVTVAPTAFNIAFGRPTTISVVWSITQTTCTGTGTVSSPNGFINFGQTSISIGGNLSRPITNPGPTVQIAETIVVPQSVSIQALEMRSASIQFTRIFTSTISCTSTTDAASADLFVTSAGASGFSLSRVALSFDDEAPVRIIGRNEKIHAVADIMFNGNGLLHGTWEIADPTSTGGQPVFRTLGRVGRYLTGGDRQRINSPPLPSRSTGLYLVRLNITDPTPNFDAPIIRYFVGDESTGARMPALPLALVSPPNQSLLAQDTPFAWDAIRGARAYQLEIYAKPRTAADSLPSLGSDINAAPPALPPGPPITGMLVPGRQLRATLSHAARAHLLPGHTYLWRVLAIGGDGSVVGESPVRELRTP
jgi:hypothetical protein